MEVIARAAHMWVFLCLCLSVSTARAAQAREHSTGDHRGSTEPRYHLPDEAASKFVTVTVGGAAAAEVLVLTEGVAIKEGGPRQTVAKFGEVYAFAPSFIAVHRDEPTQLTFWNLQADDEHDFALLDADLNVVMYEPLRALSKTSYVFQFHQEGLFVFKCLQHQPAMSGQILVLPPRPQ